MIQVKHLTKKYGPNTAVSDISFNIEKGRIYGFLGPNGAGKSTTMNIICGCLAATDGEIVINGHDIYDEPMEARRSIGYLPEIPPLYTDMTPREYLRFVGQAKKIDSSKLDEAVDSVMTKTSLHGVSDRLIRNLSKGYKQRVGIAQAIIGNPEIIILDEPTVGLDPMQIIEIRSLIRELGKDHTVILSSHVLPEISAVCDYVIVIAHGKIVASDTIENLNRSFSETEMISIEARSDEERVKNIMKRINNIERVETVPSGTGYVKCEIEVTSGKDIREDVFNAFSKENIPLLKLESSSMSLEDIFIKLVNEEHLDISDNTDSASTDAQSDDAENDSPYYEAKTKKSQKNGDNDSSSYTPVFGDGEISENSDSKEEE